MLILVGIDGSAPSLRAAKLAARLAAAGANPLLLLAVMEVPAPETDALVAFARAEKLTGSGDEVLRAFSEANLSQAASLASATGAPGFSAEIGEGDPAEIILAMAAERRAGLIALGRRGLGPIRSMLLGSVSHRVVRQAGCSVLVAP